MQTEILEGTASIAVSVPPSAVYDFLTDITHLADLSPECIRCEWNSGPGSELGAGLHRYKRGARAAVDNCLRDRDGRAAETVRF